MRRETKYAKSGDIHIAYQTVGEGSLDLVFVMGWISHLDHLWEGPSARFLARLASFSRLILFDKRGTGLSDRVTELPTIEQRMDDVRAVMDSAESRRAALLGISEGAAMCAVFAATYPERTSALVMYGAYAKRLWRPDYPWAPTPEQRQEFFDAIERGWGGVVDLDTLAPSTIGDVQFRQWWARYLQQSASPGAALALARMNGEIDIRHVLPVIRTPTLILHRTGDLDIDVGGARYMAGQIPNARYVELPGDDHLVFAGDQEAVLAEIEAFLTGDRPVPELGRVLATLLFTEIVGGAANAVRLGDQRWREIIAAHDAVIRRHLSQFRGREVKRTVSGFLAAFDGPTRAIRCACAIVEEMRDIGIEVRTGLHSDECELIDGDLRGAAVQVAAAVLARAEAGQVVVSNTITDLVAGSGIDFQRVESRLYTGSARGLDLYRVIRPIQRTAIVSEPIAEEPGARSPLSPREREVAVLIAGGLSNRQIADELSISIATVERHVANIFNRIGVHSRSQVVVWVVEQGLLPTETKH